ncbi:hypothetical protein Syun_006536 [Stephania yunnanensis]
MALSLKIVLFLELYLCVIPSIWSWRMKIYERDSTTSMTELLQVHFPRFSKSKHFMNLFSMNYNLASKYCFFLE